MEQAASPTQHRTHRFIVPTLLVLATIIGFTGAFAVWVNRQALNTGNWSSTSGKILANKKVQTALSAYLVNELFSNVDVAAELRGVLPPPAQPLAAPVAAGLQQLAGQAAPKLLARPRVQDAWVAANIAAHRQLLQVIDGGSDVVSTNGGNVTLNVHELVSELGASLGISDQVGAVQSKLQGSTGAQVRGVAQQKLGITLPAESGQLTILRSGELKTAQDVAGGVKSLAIVLPAIAFVMFALAVYLARGRRRRALRTVGWCFVAIGVLLLLIRRVGGNTIVDELVKIPSNKPAVHEIWNISTSLLYALAVALVGYGLVFVGSAWLAGGTRPAMFLREKMAPTLRESPGTAYAVAGGILLICVAWGPTPALRNIGWIAVFAALIAFGVTMLRRQTEAEFPAVETAGAAPRVNGRLDELERLVALHDRGDLTDEEFAAEKTQLAVTSKE
jgi:hypothetical protein